MIFEIFYQDFFHDFSKIFGSFETFFKIFGIFGILFQEIFHDFSKIFGIFETFLLDFWDFRFFF